MLPRSLSVRTLIGGGVPHLVGVMPGSLRLPEGGWRIPPTDTMERIQQQAGPCALDLQSAEIDQLGMTSMVCIKREPKNQKRQTRR